MIPWISESALRLLYDLRMIAAAERYCDNVIKVVKERIMEEIL